MAASLAIQELANLSAQARRTGKPIESPPSVPLQALAYEMQKLDMQNSQLLGLGKKVGFKVGPGSVPAMLKSMGMSMPGRGPLFAANRFRSGSTIPMGPAGTPGRPTLVEAEFGFLMGSSLPRWDKPYSEEEVWAAVDAMALCLELVGTRFAGSIMAKLMKEGQAITTMADNGNSWGIVVGPKVAKEYLPECLSPASTASIDSNWGKTRGRGEETRQLRGELFKNGERVGVGTAADNVPLGAKGGQGFQSLVWLANHLASGDHGGVLVAGDVVVPGAAHLTPASFQTGDVLMARLDALGTVEATIGEGEAISPLPPGAAPSSESCWSSAGCRMVGVVLVLFLTTESLVDVV